MFKRDEFLSKMHVEELDTLLFRGDALQMGLPRIFGGQVLGQALKQFFNPACRRQAAR